jgi:glycosyltransferase involved in cell wall biosynthesis
MSLLEAMSCGCAVVTTATCMIPEIIKHGENGMMSNDEDELRKYIEQLLEDEELRNRIGKAARETILHDFSEEDFISNWNKVFYMAYEVQV